MGNNQALQVGAEGIGAIAGGVLAGILVPLPLIMFGVLLILTALLLSSQPKAVISVRLAS